MATVAPLGTNPLVTNTPVPAKGKVLGFRSMQNPRDCNMASSPHTGFPPHWSSSVVNPLRKWVWAVRSSPCLAQWLLSRTLKSFSSICETSSSWTSLSSERSVTCRRVLSFLDRFSTTQGTNLCLYDFHLLWNLFRTVLNIQSDAWQVGHGGVTLFPWILESLPISCFKIKKGQILIFPNSYQNSQTFIKCLFNSR